MIGPDTSLTVSIRGDGEAEPLPDLLRRGVPSCAAWGPRGGIVGWGTAARIEAAGWADLWRQWEHVRQRFRAPAGAAVRAVVTLTFDQSDSAAPCVLVVPSVGIVSDDGARHVQLVGETAHGVPSPAGAGSASAAAAVLVPQGETAYRAAVAAALGAIDRGEITKTVIATRQRVNLPAGWAPERLAERLSRRYVDCWLYLVDGLVGASPELLVRCRSGELHSRVLAGTVDRSAPDFTEQVRAALRPGGKNRREHAFAIDSARESLAPLCSTVSASEEPHLLELPNVAHLASDVHGRLRPGVGLPEVLRQLHPTAAVGGTPRGRAVEILREAEGFDRGRFAGPVGWVDDAGDGEFAIALRGAQFRAGNRSLIACAGAGIVAGSDPGEEWAEVQAKLRPVREALAGDAS